MPHILVLTTAPDQKSAKKLALCLVEKRKVACVHLLPKGVSIYRWKQKIEQASEITLVLKTTRKRYKDVEKFILKNHPYEVPEVLAIPVIHGAKKYLDWIDREVYHRTND